MPPLSLARFSLRVDVCVPLPQVTGQVDHGLQLVITQSSGQASGLQLSSSSRLVGHETPPFSATRVIVRTRLCVPVPQLWVQREYCDHSVNSQSTAHACSLHDTVADSMSHTLPPCAASFETVRTRVRLPPPHSAVQAPVQVQDE
jgi:hypothetical protein